MFETINATALAKELEHNADNVTLLDVRTPGEFQGGHLPNAINLDYNGANFRTQVERLDKSKHYYVYCRSGMRSYGACNVMANQGFTKLANVRGGIMGWRGEMVRK
ncbi:MAG: rhodanese-like domain-containing protein [Leptolyngbya sp. SIO3F4]|nr:rhodanese-like domain-containing protein [Leptolyngbya sp. SIO3F4]